MPRTPATSQVGRKGAADRLGMTVSGIRGLEARGVLKPEWTGRQHVFSEEQLVAAEKTIVRERTRGLPSGEAANGETAARVFEAFRRGADLPEIVMAEKISPAAVRELWREFNTPLEAPARRQEATKKGKRG